MELRNKSISVFCSSSDAVSDEFKTVANELGKRITALNCRLVFGGSSKGLMRVVADAVLDNGGDVLGIMPEFMKEVEWNYDRLTNEQLVWTRTMAERKELLINRADVIVVLPGAVGTLEEVAEVLSLKRLGRYFSPVVFVNTNHFFSPLVEWLDRTVDEKLMRDEHKKMWYLADDVNDLFNYLSIAEEWPRNAAEFATR